MPNNWMPREQWDAIPHLHCHLEPRYYGDPAPGQPINPDEQVRLLGEADYEHRAREIINALG